MITPYTDANIFIYISGKKIIAGIVKKDIKKVK